MKGHKIEVIVIALLGIWFGACDRKPSSEPNAPSGGASQQSSTSVAESNTDPVAALRQLASKIPAGQSFPLAEEDIQAYRTDHPSYDPSTDSEPTYSFKVESMDVQRT